MRDFTEVRKQIERLTRIIGEHPSYEEQQACFVNAISISSYLLGVLEGEDMAREWRRAMTTNDMQDISTLIEQGATLEAVKLQKLTTISFQVLLTFSIKAKEDEE